MQSYVTLLLEILQQFSTTLKLETKSLTRSSRPMIWLCWPSDFEPLLGSGSQMDHIYVTHDSKFHPHDDQCYKQPLLQLRALLEKSFKTFIILFLQEHSFKCLKNEHKINCILRLYSLRCLHFNITELWPYILHFCEIALFLKYLGSCSQKVYLTCRLCALLFFFSHKTRPLSIYGPVTHQFVTTFFLNPFLLPARPRSCRKKYR